MTLDRRQSTRPANLARWSTMARPTACRTRLRPCIFPARRHRQAPTGSIAPPCFGGVREYAGMRPPNGARQRGQSQRRKLVAGVMSTKSTIAYGAQYQLYTDLKDDDFVCLELTGVLAAASVASAIAGAIANAGGDAKQVASPHLGQWREPHASCSALSSGRRARAAYCALVIGARQSRASRAPVARPSR